MSSTLSSTPRCDLAAMAIKLYMLIACRSSLFVSCIQVNNVIDPFKYTEVPFGNKSELKEYLKVRRSFF